MEAKELSMLIESLLFIKAQPLSINQIAKGLGQKPAKTKKALEILKDELSDRGIKLFESNKKFELVSDPDNTPALEKFVANSLPAKLSKTSLEALAIITYRGPISRFELEEIRGVNCVWILRRLLVRGLITKKKIKRRTAYTASSEFIKWLGLNSIKELPNYNQKQVTNKT